jgi:hypothetical protein
MVQQYGEAAFVKAFEVIKANQEIIFTDGDGEENILM